MVSSREAEAAGSAREIDARLRAKQRLRAQQRIGQRLHVAHAEGAYNSLSCGARKPRSQSRRVAPEMKRRLARRSAAPRR